MSSINNRKPSTNSLFPEDKDFNSSCCDYNSDVFKEQPSLMDYSNISARNRHQMVSDLADEENENFIISPTSTLAPSG